MNRSIARIISTIFEPLLVLAVIAIVGGARAQLSVAGMTQYLLSLFFCMVGPVFVFRMWLVKKHGIDWDIHDRRKRIRPLLALCGFVIVDLFVVSLLHNAVLNHLFLVFVVWIVGFLLVTLRWKISGHAGISALATGLIIFWYGWQWWPVLLAPIIVGWARVVRRDHTLAQVTAGTVYSWVIVLVSSVMYQVS